MNVVTLKDLKEMLSDAEKKLMSYGATRNETNDAVIRFSDIRFAYSGIRKDDLQIDGRVTSDDVGYYFKFWAKKENERRQIDPNYTENEGFTYEEIIENVKASKYYIDVTNVIFENEIGE